VELGLSGKVAVVAASSKGLGKASALALAREGARVTICARTAADLERAGALIRHETGAEVLAIPADLSTADGVTSVVDAAAKRFGGVDILVANSGGPPIGQFGDFSDDDWRQAFETVTLTFVRFVRAVLPHMRNRSWGRIIGIQSMSVKEPVRNIDLSNGIRPGLAGLMKALMPDLAQDDITINLVLPGSFRTSRIFPGAENEPPPPVTPESKAGLRANGIPAGRFGEAGELGDLVAFLASARAAYITGATYQIDGGRISSNV
jgi:3-oxoacyl-[acyl-carrier protein] reductase